MFRISMTKGPRRLTLILEAVVMHHFPLVSPGELFPVVAHPFSRTRFDGSLYTATVHAHHVVHVSLAERTSRLAGSAAGRTAESQVREDASLDQFDRPRSLRITSHDGPGLAGHHHDLKGPRKHQDWTEHRRDQADRRAAGLRMPTMSDARLVTLDALLDGWRPRTSDS